MKVGFGMFVGVLLMVGLVASYSYWDKFFPPKVKPQPPVVVHLKRIHAKIISSAGKISLELLMKET